MRAAVADHRLVAVAGPVLGDWADPAPATPIPQTPDVPVTFAAVVTLTATGGGHYVLNSPTTLDGRRAYVWNIGYLDDPPGTWASGIPHTPLRTAVVGTQVIAGPLPRGIPPSTKIRSAAPIQGAHGTTHHVVVWPLALTGAQTAAVMAWLARRHGIPPPP